MSAIQPFTPVILNRRSAARFRITDRIPVVIGRAEGTLVDVAPRGARVRHGRAVGRGTTIRLSFEWRGHRFAAPAIVVASRLVALEGVRYESRLDFGELPPGSKVVLQLLIDSLEDDALRRATEDVCGASDGHTVEAPIEDGAGFIRCRFFSAGRWERLWTRDATQPDTGFTVPAAVPEFELAQLCRSFEHAGEDGRLLLRNFAEAMTHDRASSSAMMVG